MEPAGRHVLAALLAAGKKPLLIGGQAVVEGVMMRGAEHVATAVRLPSGKVRVRRRLAPSLAKKLGVARIPFLRGAVILAETLVLGLRELNWSAEQAGGSQEKVSSWELGVTIGASLALALALFKLLPFFLAGVVTGRESGWLLNLADALFKVLLFILYLLLIGRLPDVQRLFQYHGAEHKAVNCYEAGERLTVKNAARFTTRQPRCGTTFLVHVFVAALFLYVLIPPLNFWLNLGVRVLLLPLIAGIAYEWIRLAGAWHERSPLVRALNAPGMAFQALTLREPSGEQLAVAIKALTAILKAEGVMRSEALGRIAGRSLGGGGKGSG